MNTEVADEVEDVTEKDDRDMTNNTMTSIIMIGNTIAETRTPVIQVSTVNGAVSDQVALLGPSLLVPCRHDPALDIVEADTRNIVNMTITTGEESIDLTINNQRNGLETQTKALMTSVYGLIRFTLESCNVTLNIFQDFVFTDFKQERQCLWNYRLLKSLLGIKN